MSKSRTYQIISPRACSTHITATSPSPASSSSSPSSRPTVPTALSLYSRTCPDSRVSTLITRFPIMTDLAQLQSLLVNAPPDIHPFSLLVQLAQARCLSDPQSTVRGVSTGGFAVEIGFEHPDRSFGFISSTAEGASKQIAKREAAAGALLKLRACMELFCPKLIQILID